MVMAHAIFKLVLTARLWWDEWAERVEWGSARSSHKLMFLAGRFFESFYESTLVTYGGSPEYEEQHRLATRLLNIGFGFFLLITINSYTANLAAFLSYTHPPYAPYIQNMQEATQQQELVCAHIALRATYDSIHPNANFHFMWLDDASELYAAANDVGCNAVIMSERAMKVQQRLETMRCDLGFIKVGLVVSVEVALPARKEVKDTPAVAHLS